MNIGLQRIARVPGIAAGLALLTTLIYPLATEAQQPSSENTARKIGTVKTIHDKTIALKADSGPDVNVIIQDSTRLAQLPAGQTDLKAATPIQFRMFRWGTACSLAASLETMANR